MQEPVTLPASLVRIRRVNEDEAKVQSRRSHWRRRQSPAPDQSRAGQSELRHRRLVGRPSG